MKWYVLYTKPKQELRVSEWLKKIGVCSYCPTYTELKQYSDRKKKVVKPLLSSYIFVKIDHTDRMKVFDVPGVVRYLFWSGKPVIVLQEEIKLMENTSSGIYESISLTKLKKGADYIIPEGPLKGQFAKIIGLNQNKIKLELPSLGILATLKTA